MSQRWRVVGEPVSDLIDPKFELQTHRRREEGVTARPTGRSGLCAVSRIYLIYFIILLVDRINTLYVFYYINLAFGKIERQTFKKSNLLLSISSTYLFAKSILQTNVPVNLPFYNDEYTLLLGKNRLVLAEIIIEVNLRLLLNFQL